MKQPSLHHRHTLRTFIVAVIMILANATAALAQSTFSGGDGTAEDPYQIASVEDLLQLATDVNSGTTYEDTYFKVMNDIDFNQATDESLRPTAAWNVESTQSNFTPIGRHHTKVFKGIFNGNFKTISGLRIYINSNNLDSYAALFGYTYGATVTGVKLDDARITGPQYCGGIVAYTSKSSTVSYCTVTNHVAIHADRNASNYHGGIVGYNAASCSVTDCTSSAMLTIADGVTGCQYYGGIVGCSNDFNSKSTTISGNVAIGVTISAAADTYYGAICGYIKLYYSTLTDNYYLNCTVAGTVNATNVGVYGYGSPTDNSVRDVDGARHIYAYKLTLADGITADGAIALTIGGYNYYLQGTTITLSGQQTGTLPENTFYKGYCVNGNLIDGTSFIMPAKDTKVTSNTISAYMLNLAEGISASPDPAITVGGTGYYIAGTTITLSGRPDAEKGYFYPYTLNGTAIFGTTFEMPAQNLTIALGEKTSDWMYLYEGTCEDPYQVKTANQLDQIATRVNEGTTFSGKYFKLMNDIAYEYDTSTKNNYTPIGKKNGGARPDKPFSGTFDGGGHTVSGIRIYKGSNGWDDSNLGLFGFVYDGTVKNVTVADTRIIGYNCCGGIVGEIDGFESTHDDSSIVENCHALSDVGIHAVTDADMHGGIAGHTNNSTIRCCSSAVTLSVDGGLPGCAAFGGIVGCNDGTISHCFAFGVSIPVAVGNNSNGSGAITGNLGSHLEYNFYSDCNVGGKMTNIGDPSGDINYIGNPNGALPGISLYDDCTANTTTIANFNEQMTGVILYGRTLYKDGSWNTLCLPLDIYTWEFYDTPLDGATLMTLDKSNTGYDSSTGTLTLDFVDTDHIEAGVPCIVKWDKPDDYDANPAAYDIKNPVFYNVTIADLSDYSGTAAEKCQAFLNDRATTSSDGCVTFRGTFDSEAIYASPATNLYVGTDNTLYYPLSNDFRINACRAYFQLNNGLTCGNPSSPNAIRAFNLNFGDEATGIISIENGKLKIEDDNWYSLDGRKLSGKPTAKGLYIHGGVKVVIK